MAGSNTRSRPIFRHAEGLGAAQPGLFVASDGRLESDHFVRRLRDLVETLFGEDLRSGVSLSGGFGYDPVLLLSVWLYGFLDGVPTSRRLETLCRYDARYEFLAGSHRPDHTTLSRFRSSLGESLDEILVRLCLAAQEMGILKRKTLVVDGTKIAALRNQWSRARKEADAAEDIESEASTMVSHGRYLVGYNIQAAADADSGLLVGYVVTDKAGDEDQLEELCDAVERQSGALSERVVADRGYDSSKNAIALEAKGVEGYLMGKRPKPPLFTPNEEGQMACAAGHVATVNEWHDQKRNQTYSHYRVSRCSNCTLKEQCSGKGERQRAMKVLQIDPQDLKHAANARCLTEEGKELTRQRGQTIERPFAVMKQNFGLRRFRLRGIKGAAIEFGIAVLAFNIQILMRLLA